MQSRLMRVALGLCFCLAQGCSSHAGLRALSTHGEQYAEAANADYRFSWALPKTVFDLDATWTFGDCRISHSAATQPQYTLSATVTIAFKPHAVADNEVGWIWLDVGAIQSRTQDHGIDISTAPGTHLLQSLNFSATDQTGAIAGNILGGVVKLAPVAGAALALPGAAFAPPQPPSPAECLAAQAIADSIKSKQQALHKAQLAARNDEDATARRLTAEILALQKQLSVSVSMKAIDPKLHDADAQQRAASQVAALVMPLPSVQALAWIKAPERFAEWFGLSVELDFAHALPKDALAAALPARLFRDELFREVVYIPVQIRRIHSTDQDRADDVLWRSDTPIPFAQFGKPRTLPLDAPVFGKVDWTLTFNEFGEVTQAKWGSVATGLGASQLFSDAASAANGIQAERAQAAQAPDAQTRALQRQNDALQTIIDNATSLQQCQALQAQGRVAACP
jgi:hypothetical protein